MIMMIRTTQMVHLPINTRINQDLIITDTIEVGAIIVVLEAVEHITIEEMETIEVVTEITM
jgi:hypothetical protein